MNESWIIVTGCPVDGFSFWCGADGLPFHSHDEALEVAESNDNPLTDWWITPLNSVADSEALEEEDDA